MTRKQEIQHALNLAAGKLTPAAAAELTALMASPDERVALVAAGAVLAFAHREKFDPDSYKLLTEDLPDA
jgi:hypothetical protein